MSAANKRVRDWRRKPKSGIRTFTLKNGIRRFVTTQASPDITKEIGKDLNYIICNPTKEQRSLLNRLQQSQQAAVTVGPQEVLAPTAE